jgi:hypothetical protein
MIFIETAVFTAQIKALVSDEEYTALQHELVADPPKPATSSPAPAACGRSAWPRKAKANAAVRA